MAILIFSVWYLSIGALVALVEFSSEDRQDIEKCIALVFVWPGLFVDQHVNGWPVLQDIKNNPIILLKGLIISVPAGILFGKILAAIKDMG